MDNPKWCHDCAEGWDYHRSLGVALCSLHRAAPRMLTLLKLLDGLVVPTKLIDPAIVERILTQTSAILRDLEGESNG